MVVRGFEMKSADWWRFRFIWRPMNPRYPYSERGVLTWTDRIGKSFSSQRTFDFFTKRGLFSVVFDYAPREPSRLSLLLVWVGIVLGLALFWFCVIKWFAGHLL